MHYLGLDVHKKFIVLQHMDANGYLGMSEKIPVTKEALDYVLDQIPEKVSITFEAGRNWWWLHEYLKAHKKVSKVCVVDARRSRKLAQELSVFKGYGRAKNDRIDAEMLAEEDRIRLAPQIRIPRPDEMIERSLVRYRIRLIRERTRISNYLQGILSLHGVNISTSQLTRHYDSNVTYLKVLDVHHLFIINELIEIIRFFDTRIEMISEKLNTLLPANDPRMQLIMSIPGFGIELSRIVVVELRDISEFPNRVSLRSYAGLAPFVSESADKKKKSRLNKHSNRYLRYALIMAAHHARWHPKFSSKYRRDVKKHNKVIAKVNLARRLCNILYWVMTRQQPYQG